MSLFRYCYFLLCPVTVLHQDHDVSLVELPLIIKSKLNHGHFKPQLLQQAQEKHLGTVISHPLFGQAKACIEQTPN